MGRESHNQVPHIIEEVSKRMGIKVVDGIEVGGESESALQMHTKQKLESHLPNTNERRTTRKCKH